MSHSEISALVTIDGPAASGKTSVSRELSQRFGWPWVSTGAFYRGIAFMVKEEGIDLHNEFEITEMIENKDWEVCLSPIKTQFVYKGKDVTDQIYLEEVGSVASAISQFPKVRESLLAAQRNCYKKEGGLVAEGRDCGTVIFPQADVKIYLTASSQNRAARRASEEGISVEETAAAQEIRDKQDSLRATAPMQVPENAHVVDASDMDLQQVVDHIYKIVRENLEK